MKLSEKPCEIPFNIPVFKTNTMRNHVTSLFYGQPRMYFSCLLSWRLVSVTVFFFSFICANGLFLFLFLVNLCAIMYVITLVNFSLYFLLFKKWHNPNLLRGINTVTRAESTFNFK
jgi:hypothetical protein